MFTNYWTTALGVFKQQKQHFLLNVMGLSVGFCAAILVALFTINEMSYDDQHPNASNVYRVSQDYSKLGLGELPLFNFIQSERALAYTEVQAFFALTSVEEIKKIEINVTIEGERYKLDHLYGATNNISSFIHLPVISGDLISALSTPNHLALSRSEAIRLFGNVNIIGKTLAHKKGNYTIAAVFEDLPENTHFTFNSLTYIEHDPAKKFVNNSYIYLRLMPDVDIPALEKTLTALYFDGQLKGKVDIKLQPLLDLHLTAKTPFEMKVGGTSQVVNICAALSILLIVIASFNFINMTIAQSTKRAKEVGVRKALGASKGQLVNQFLCESLLVALFALLIAYAMVELSLPSFNLLVDRQLTLDYGSSFSVITLFIAATVGILAGLYPALFISSFSAKRVLSGDLQRGTTAIWVRKILLTLQIALSVSLIIAAIVLQQQLAFLQNIPLGYEIKQRLVISDLGKDLVLTKENNILMTQISKISGVNKISVLDTELTVSMNNTMKPVWPNGESSERLTPIIGTGYDIADTLGLTLLAGRDFSAKFSSDWFYKKNTISHIATIITESVAQEAGYTNYQDIIGKEFTFRSSIMRIVGVVADIKVGNGKVSSSNIMFLCGWSQNTVVDILLTIDEQQLLLIKQQISQILAEHWSIYEPKISLLTDNYERVLQGNMRISNVVSLFSGLAIFLTCLGTFGLASFAALCRQKEVTMRKVLGASQLSLVNLLAKEFLILVIISIVIAYPLTYWLVDDWLENFNDHIVQDMWAYLISALSITTITWLTVASVAFKAANTKPSLILRNE
jgi:putative ABC transport system permease protein